MIKCFHELCPFFKLFLFDEGVYVSVEFVDVFCCLCSVWCRCLSEVVALPNKKGYFWCVVGVVVFSVTFGDVFFVCRQNDGIKLRKCSVYVCDGGGV